MPWIDYAALKEQAEFLPVLEYYGIKTPAKATGSIKVKCPFHDDEKPSLSVAVGVGAGKYQCFGCREKGNILDFVQAMEEGSLRDAAEKLASICDIDVPMTNRKPTKQNSRPERDENERTANSSSGLKASRSGENLKPDEQSGGESGSADPINPPLPFVLKSDQDHPYVAERLNSMNLGDESIDAGALIETFSLGVGTRGMMKNRLAIPIHNERAELVAYAGRWALPEDQLPDGEDKYKLPPKFKKSHVLFNLHRVMAMKEDDPELDWVVVTEGYFGTVRLHALGVPSVALMGTDISEDQIRLLRSELDPKRVILLLDGDEQGKKAAAERVLPMLAPHVFVRNATALLDDDEQPDEMSDGRAASITLLL